MRKTPLALMVALSAATCASAAVADPQPENPDSTGFTFTDVIVVPTTPVKDQNKSGTCWSFAGISFLEDEVLRKGGPELDLSEMYVVKHCYSDKADKYMRMDGKINFAQGGTVTDVLYVLDRYGLVPESAMDGLQYGEDKHMHYEMFDGLNGYLNGVSHNANKRLSGAWKKGLDAILDAYLGEYPETFEYNGKTYTPTQFAKEMGLSADNFISLTSYTHHPFYVSFPIEIADNWTWAQSMNVPLDEMKRVLDNALENGYTVAWSADVSEPTFKWYKGYAVLPQDKTEEDMDNSEQTRWAKLSDKDREALKNDIKGPVKEREITQESRQKSFDNKETTDDHGMVIVGTATDQKGNRYYKVKNSWDTNHIYDGFFYVSEPYFLDKTISILVNKEAVPKDIAKKIGR